MQHILEMHNTARQGLTDRASHVVGALVLELCCYRAGQEAAADCQRLHGGSLHTLPVQQDAPVALQRLNMLINMIDAGIRVCCE